MHYHFSLVASSDFSPFLPSYLHLRRPQKRTCRPALGGVVGRWMMRGWNYCPSVFLTVRPSGWGDQEMRKLTNFWGGHERDDGIQITTKLDGEWERGRDWQLHSNSYALSQGLRGYVLRTYPSRQTNNVASRGKIFQNFLRDKMKSTVVSDVGN